jgi:hypothetical protein
MISLLQKRKSSKLLALCLLLCLLGGCSTVKKEAAAVTLPQSYMAGVAGGVVYNATFRYKDFQASGLLVAKRVQPSEYHVVLLSKFGVSLMEFKLNEAGIQWIKTFEQLGKKRVTEMLERDFRVLLLSGLDKPRKLKLQKQEGEVLTFKLKGATGLRLRADAKTGRVLYAENRGFINPVKTKVSFLYKNDGDIPEEILLRHSNVAMSLDLNLLKVINAER